MPNYQEHNKAVQIKLLKPKSIRRQPCKAGEVVEVHRTCAELLIAEGAAEPVAAATPPKGAKPD